MKQVYTQAGDDDKVPLSYDYDISEDPIFTTLKYSHNSDWSEDIKGQVAASLFDDGYFIEIKMEGNKKIKLEYDQAERLFILLLNDNKHRIEIRESKLIKSV